MKILLGISGASGVNLGLSLLENLLLFKDKKDELFCVISEGARLSFNAENKLKNLSLDELLSKFSEVKFFDNNNLAAPISSGSFKISHTIIAPCSISTLANISNGVANTLILRAAAVALKEQKRLILGVREMPFSAISLKQMSKLSKLGVSIAPPVFASYAADDLESLMNFFVGKWLDLLDIKHNLYERWSEK